MAETELKKELDVLSQDEKTRRREIKRDRRKGITVRYMYRTASRNHVDFVAIGDRRANILIGTCTLIISITFTVLLRGSTEPTIYHVPGIILIVTCTITMIMAMISTRPYNARGFYTMEDIMTQQDENLLFFENFYRMKRDDYEAAMDKLIDDNIGMRHAMIRDLHGLGVSVARKYKFLRISYDVLMFGIILTVLSMFIAMFMQY